MRKCVAIMYHDVLEEGRRSGFTGNGAERYKLSAGEFELHLAEIRRAVGERAVRRVDDEECLDGASPVFLTFDDGGESAATVAAGALERYGWRGHFFITTDYIGAPGFLSASQIRELHRRGHAIGSHSCSHPARISQCGWEPLVREWTESVRVLSGILGEPVRMASVPGGYHSKTVERAAIEAGIRFLFTSEPTMRTQEAGNCLVLGRYSIRRGMPPAMAGDFAAGRAGARWKEALLWNLKKAAKAAGGEYYLRTRAALLARKG
ncbi:MAG TPA: polysaccharide deacetylase family protein [Bryobacteraceae bacterium]|nr:polysaccharide deacetylase family protein [Bryobacteraceae bacterium]HOQ45137.1 polysaccharide deacetylase family protein [Bryobacteraceae bacterium]HPU71209.1 polysaccharide deacetylase family protein [Bryobacteraceae bacterium]